MTQMARKAAIIHHLKNGVVFFALIFSSISILQAQVTIGSNIIPNEGALLDLKENNNDIQNSERGLGLPRAILNSLTISDGSNNLATTVKDSDASNSWDKDLHIGLVLFNVNESYSCSGGPDRGLYVWNGEIWEDIYSDKPIRPTLTLGTDQYDGANTYIALRNSSVTIPIKRAYQIWNEFGNGSNNTATGHVLPLATSHFAGYPNGTLSVEVLWQEASDASTNGVLASTSASINIATPIEESTFTFNTGSKSGNALVALKLGGKVLWQWQIWVPQNDPTATAYGYNTGTHVYWYMDRYLGALSTEKQKWNGNPEERNAHGLYYQWGRPTPFQKFGDGIPFVHAAAGEAANLQTALLTPSFIQSDNTSVGNTATQDWYSNSDIWHTRWGDGTNNDTGTKTAFDPCPQGWRVPARKGNQPPWRCLNESNARYSDSYSGYDFNELGRILGYYPLGGYRVRSSAYIYDLGVLGTVWSATPTTTEESQRLLLAQGTIYPASSHFRANGLSVRCVQDY